MGLSNMLYKLFKKDNADVSAQVPVKFKDFDSIIVPPEPRTTPILIYKSLDLDFGSESAGTADNGFEEENSSASESESEKLTEGD